MRTRQTWLCPLAPAGRGASSWARCEWYRMHHTSGTRTGGGSNTLKNGGRYRCCESVVGEAGGGWVSFVGRNRRWQRTGRAQAAGALGLRAVLAAPAFAAAAAAVTALRCKACGASTISRGQGTKGGACRGAGALRSQRAAGAEWSRFWRCLLIFASPAQSPVRPWLPRCCSLLLERRADRGQLVAARCSLLAVRCSSAPRRTELRKLTPAVRPAGFSAPAPQPGTPVT